MSISARIQVEIWTNTKLEDAKPKVHGQRAPSCGTSGTPFPGVERPWPHVCIWIGLLHWNYDIRLYFDIYLTTANDLGLDLRVSWGITIHRTKTDDMLQLMLQGETGTGLLQVEWTFSPIQQGTPQNDLYLQRGNVPLIILK